MSPSTRSKSKSKSKSSARAANEQKVSKTAGSANGGNGSSASAYNPVSGTFHLLETSSFSSSPPSQSNGRFQTIDDTDDHSSSPHGTVSEYDSVSNNGSCSGESEDMKEKVSGLIPRQETVAGPDNDRREKIRLKNEKKHQRQRERRAQELHDRCSGYLMSRKLESLSQQLVAMGFSSERATLALIMNEGRLEDSISWLFDGNEEEAHNKDSDVGSKANLKIDISEELAKISQLEVKYKCSKQEVERAVVACEGDLMKAEESLRTQKQEQQGTPSKVEPFSATQSLMRPQEKPTASMLTPQGRNEREFTCTKPIPVTAADSELGNLKFLSSKTNQQISLAEKRWPPTGLSVPASSSITLRAQVSPTVMKPEVLHGVNKEKLIQHAAARQPVKMMQRPQPVVPRSTVSSLSSSPSVSTGYYPSDVAAIETVRSNMRLLQAQRLGSFGLENQAMEQFYQPAYKESPPVLTPFDTMAELGGSWNMAGRSPSNTIASDPQASWIKHGASSAAHTNASSLGLFSTWRPSGTLDSSSSVDWNSGGMMPDFDYTRIDWTLDTNSAASKSSGMWLGLSSMLRTNPTMRLGASNRVRTADVVSGGACEWTSPFAGKDIFSLPRQFVTSPSP